MFELHKLAPLLKKKKRVGRGGSRGGTSGRGHKGQNARSGGGVSIGFEGGQMPLFRRLPKRGFTNARFKKETKAVNLGRLNEVFDDGAEVTRELLIEKGVIKLHKSKRPFKLKILGDGTLTKKLMVQADLFSKSAIKAIEDVGGQVRVTGEM